jgi:hypothetical protein
MNISLPDKFVSIGLVLRAVIHISGLIVSIACLLQLVVGKTNFN